MGMKSVRAVSHHDEATDRYLDRASELRRLAARSASQEMRLQLALLAEMYETLAHGQQQIEQTLH